MKNLNSILTIAVLLTGFIFSSCKKKADPTPTNNQTTLPPSWQSLTSLPGGKNLNSIAFGNSAGYAVGDSGTIFSYIQNGAPETWVWTKENSNISNKLNFVYFAFANYPLIAFGDAGMI